NRAALALGRRRRAAGRRSNGFARWSRRTATYKEARGEARTLRNRNRAYAQPPRLDAGVDSAGVRCECIGQFACARQPSNWSRRRVPAHRIAPQAAARRRTIAAKNGVARTIPNQGRLTAGRRTFGIATLVQPRFTTCSSHASFAMFARPYAISSPRYT